MCLNIASDAMVWTQEFQRSLAAQLSRVVTS